MRRLRYLGILLAILFVAALPALGAVPAQAACKVPANCTPNPGGGGTGGGGTGEGSTGTPTNTPGSHSARVASQAAPQITGANISIVGPQSSSFKLAGIFNFSPKSFLTGSAYNPVTHSFYVVSEDNTLHTVWVINAFTLQVSIIQDPSFCNAAGVAVNTNTGYVFVNNQSPFGCGNANNTVSVISPNNQVVAVLRSPAKAPLYATKIAVDSGTNQLFAAYNTFGFPTPPPGEVVQWDLNTNSVVGIYTPGGQSGFIGVAVDQASHLVFASNNFNGDYFPNTLMEIDPFQHTMVATNIPTGNSPGSIRAAQGKIYVALGADFGPFAGVQTFTPTQPSLSQIIRINNTDADSNGNDDGFANLAVSQTGSMILLTAPDPGNMIAVDPFGLQLADIFFGSNGSGSEPEVSEVSIAPNGVVIVNLPDTGQVVVLQGPHG